MTDKKYTYTNGLTFEQTCNNMKHHNLITECDKLTTTDNIRNLIVASGLNRYTIDQYKKDKYLLPIYVYGILIGDKDTIYFIDEHRGTDNDRIWFMGGNLISLDTQPVNLDYHKDITFQNNLVIQAFNQLTRAGFETGLLDFDVPGYFKNFFATVPCQSQTSRSGSFRLNFNYVYYSNIYSRNKGIYIFTPIVVEPNSKGYLVPYTRSQHRVLMTMKDKDQLTKESFKREIGNAAGRDARWDLFDIITCIFNSLS